MCRQRLFEQRQKNGMQQDHAEKLPDFVRRLEEALYRTASSKVSAGHRCTRANTSALAN